LRCSRRQRKRSGYAFGKGEIQRPDRQVAAEREIPLTLERAPYDLRQAVGHFGAYREGVGQLVTRLRETFDPKGILAVAVEGQDGR